MSRSTPEWIGKTPDAQIPPRVRLRVFERHNGICHLSGRRIRAGEQWDADHVVALVNGGEHRESNLAPALRDKHREKTAADVAEKATVYRVRAKHLGLTPKRTKIQSAGFRKAAPQRTASRPIERTRP
jgi:5-methylcytosine-specific restriction enzyme A